MTSQISWGLFRGRRGVWEVESVLNPVVDHLVALGSALTPAKHRVPLGASMATQQKVETILGSRAETRK